MLISSSADVFGPTVPVGDVSALISLVARGQHDWSPDLDLSAVETYLRQNLAIQAESYLSLARNSFTASTYRSASTPTVRATAANLRELLEDLGRPAVLVVEDLVSDKSFIVAIARAFGRDAIAEALSEGWLEIRHAGGKGRVRAVATDCAQRFSVVVRVFALLDSDKLYEDHQTASHDVEAALSAAGIGCHVLRMREAENYAPNKALASSSAASSQKRRMLSAKIDALKRLRSDQRAYYDIKKGFRLKDGEVVIPTEQTELFKEVSQRDRKRLVHGFGDDVLARLEDVAISLSAKDFSALDSKVVPELESLLDAVAGVL